MKHFLVFMLSLVVLTLPASICHPAYAYEKVAVRSAMFTPNYTINSHQTDPRAKKLEKFLRAHHSPLADYADVFIQEADKNNLDWKLVAAISGVESGFGKETPPYSYNGWGWGVFGNHVHRFSSWEDAISTISSGLRNDYMNKWNAQDVQSIGHIYAASPTWANRVTYFMNKIDTYQDTNELAVLPISL